MFNSILSQGRTLILRRPLLLEGEGNWETTLQTTGGLTVLRLEQEAASGAVVRNLNIFMTSTTVEGTINAYNDEQQCPGDEGQNPPPPSSCTACALQA